jgi:hypothetical protein
MGGMIALPIFFLNSPFLHFFYFPLKYSIKWMNDIISWVYTLPLGRVQGWWPSSIECVLLILLSVVLIHWLTHKTYRDAIPTWLTLNVFMLYLLVSEIKEQNKVELIASNNRNHPKIWIKNQMSIIQVYGDSSLIHSDYAEKYNILPKNIIRIFPGNLIYTNARFTISQNNIIIDSSRYTWITKRSDTLPSYPDQYLIFLSKTWRNRKNEQIHPAYVHTLPSMDKTMIYSLFPQSKINISQKDYIQLSIQ